jgi:hypothetical protein
MYLTLIVKDSSRKQAQMNKSSDCEIKDAMLKDHPFLLGLTSQGMVYQGYSPETVIKVAACKGKYGDWTAYFLTPDTPFGDVLNYGSKLPQVVAQDLFPEWAKKGLNWRA